jgi:spermidine synthase
MERIYYTDLHTIYPTEELKSETYTINSFVLTEEKIRFEEIRNYRNSWLTRGLKADFPYVRLIKNGDGVMMSDTPMERNTNKEFIQKANGDVIIFGLGLGLVIIPLLKKENVTSILVVELYQDLIDLVEPILKQHDLEDKLTIVQGDCFEFHNKMPKGRKFDSIYGDIWIDIDTDNYEQMKTLTKNWKNRVNRENKESFITHWMKDHLKYEIQKEKRNRYYWY